MWKIAGAGLIGVVAGSLVMLLAQSPNDPAVDRETSAFATPDGSSGILAASSAEIVGLNERLAALESQVGDLAHELETLRGQSVLRAEGAGNANAAPPPGAFRMATARGGPAVMFAGRGAESAEAEINRLVEAGFTRQRAEWLRQRSDALAMEQMQARYDAERNGEPLPMENIASMSPELALRKELSDAEYERYLDALGRPTRVSVFEVIGDSPAAQAGIRSGDEILSYDGTRVFDMRELNPLTLAGDPGEPVVVEVERNDQRMAVVVPRGPLGIAGGGMTVGPNGATSIMLIQP
jgi:membrane-associated protease RseP (regulator of RpoE activity)